MHVYEPSSLSGSQVGERSRLVLVVDDGRADMMWPQLRERIALRLAAIRHRIRWISLTSGDRLRDLPAAVEATAVILIGDVYFDQDDLRVMRQLVIVATTPWSLPPVDHLQKRGILVVDGVRGLCQARAEVALALILASLHRVVPWHDAMRADPVQPACGTNRYAFGSGSLRDKDVCVIGGGFTGYKIADLCAAVGAQIRIVDLDSNQDELYDELRADVIGLDEVPLTADIVVIAEPNRPAHRLILDREMVNALREGTLIVSVTSVLGIDVDALRERVCRNELVWASDVRDADWLQGGDPMIGRDNVIILPGIATNTPATNHEIADTLADNVLQVLDGGKPLAWDLITAHSVLPRLDAPSGTHLLTAATSQSAERRTPGHGVERSLRQE
ncbi:NAD(P)-dependent oxidoreductase [Nocardia sp. SC052]|uniref:NAD(P)-dependent oxidoreductase n=1 Tax=Nocardia sichangensis TaxID=3385975 RepID=UPI00399F9BFC